MQIKNNEMGMRFPVKLYTWQELTGILDKTYKYFQYLGPKLMISLMEKLLSQGIDLLIVNLYIWFQVANYLLDHKTHYTGALCKDGNVLPKDIIEPKNTIKKDVLLVWCEKGSEIKWTVWKVKKNCIW